MGLKTRIQLFVAIIFLTFVSGQGNLPPFCSRCVCSITKNVTIPYDVECKENVMGIIFNDSYWINAATNASYKYNSVVVRNNPMVSLTHQFPNSSLKILNLAKNSIYSIDDNVFQNLQDMEELILSYNQIEILHPDAFKGVYLPGQYLPLKSLRILKLDHNRIHTLDDDIFKHTSELTELDLSHNSFSTLDHQTVVAITSLFNLQKLNLGYNGFTALPDTFLHTPKFLNFLDLSGNKLDHIPPTLGEAHKLETLFINDNPIVNLTIENGFPNVSTLRYLHMRNMKELCHVGPGSLNKLHKLEELYLFDNMKLSTIDKEALSIKLDGAEYETWPPLTKLFIQNNKLSYIDRHLVLAWDKLLDFDLSDNPWTCECEIQWFLDELLPIYQKIDKLRAQTLRCAAPVEMVKYTFFELLNKQTTMRCLDVYGHRPERDGTLLVGILAGILLTIPLVLFLIYAYQRNWFGFFDNSPASYSRQFYKRTENSDDLF